MSVTTRWLDRDWLRWCAALAVGAGIMALIGLVWRFRFETNDDLAFAYMMQGRELIAPQTDFYFFFRGLAGLLARLQGWFGPSAYGVFILGLLFVAVARWLVTVLERHRGDPLRLLSVVALSAYLVMLTFWPVNFTRVSFFAAFVGFYGISARWSRRPPQTEGPVAGSWLRRVELPLDVALMVVGYAMRPQAGMLALGVCVVLTLMERVERRQLLRQATIALTVVVTFKAYDFAVTDEADREYIRRYAIGSLLLDTQTGIEVPTDPLDRTRLALAAQWFFFDEDAYNSALLEKYVKSGYPVIAARARQLPARAGRLARESWEFLGWWLAGVLGGVLGLALLQRDWRRTGGVAGRVIVIYLAIVALDVIIGMKARVLQPVLAVLLLELLLQLRTVRPAPVRWAVYLVPPIAVCAALMLHASREAGARAVYDRACASTAAAVEAIDQRIGERIILATLGGPLEGIVTYAHPLSIRFPRRSTVIVPLQGWVTQYAGYRQMLERIGGGDGVDGLLQQIAGQPERFALVGREGAIRTFLRYARDVYGRQLHLRKVATPELVYYAFGDR